MNEILDHLSRIGIIPVAVLDSSDDAIRTAEALNDGGLPCMEITLRTNNALTTLRAVKEAWPSMCLGAGTVLTVEQAAAAVDAGAAFVVAPGLNRQVVEYCQNHDIPVIPGIATPTELESAMSMGVECMKVFPAEVLGGVEYLSSLAGPYKTARFVPTGGIHQGNVADYLSLPNVAACGGSWMVKPDMVKAGKFEEIKARTMAAVDAMLALSLAHVGINGSDDQCARKSVDEMQNLVRGTVKEGASSFFVGSQFEFTKKPFPGGHGHIALGTRSILRAMYHLERRGVVFNHEKKSMKDGSLISIYMEKEIAGFAVHLLQV